MMIELHQIIDLHDMINDLEDHMINDLHCRSHDDWVALHDDHMINDLEDHMINDLHCRSHDDWVALHDDHMMNN